LRVGFVVFLDDDGDGRAGVAVFGSAVGLFLFGFEHNETAGLDEFEFGADVLEPVVPTVIVCMTDVAGHREVLVVAHRFNKFFLVVVEQHAFLGLVIEVGEGEGLFGFGEVGEVGEIPDSVAVGGLGFGALLRLVGRLFGGLAGDGLDGDEGLRFFFDFYRGQSVSSFLLALPKILRLLTKLEHILSLGKFFKQSHKPL
jgi:hypothetical protein